MNSSALMDSSSSSQKSKVVSRRRRTGSGRSQRAVGVPLAGLRVCLGLWRDAVDVEWRSGSGGLEDGRRRSRWEDSK